MIVFVSLWLLALVIVAYVLAYKVMEQDVRLNRVASDIDPWLNPLADEPDEYDLDVSEPA